MDDARLRALLHDLYAEGASHIPPPPPPPRRPARRGRRFFPVAAAVAAVGAAAVALFIFVPSGNSDSPARLVPIATGPTTQPAQPSAAPTPSVSVEIPPKPPIVDPPTYLPAGAELAARSVVTPGGGVVLSYQIAGQANVHQGIDGVLQVWRGSNKDGKAKLASSNPTPGYTYQNVVVNGHPAVLTTPTSGVGGYSVEWLANQQVIAVTMVHKQTAAGVTGISVTELLKVAASVP